jgi:hypothetical protein
MSRKRSKKAAAFSPLLVRLIEAAERAKEDAEGTTSEAQSKRCGSLVI